MAHSPANRPCGSRLSLALPAVALTFALAASLSSAADVKVPQLQSAAEKGFIPQEIELAAAYYTGHGVKQDDKMAAYWYRKAAESGDPGAQNEIGYFYQTGIGVSKDPARAFHWYQLAASSGFVTARLNMGVLYLWGIGVPKNEALAIEFFQDAVHKKSGTAATYLGDMYYFGMGVAQDRTVAENWFVTGARLHDPFAACNLGLLFSGQDNHPVDLPKAAKLLRQSADAGYIPAMSALGLMLVNHPELAQSPQEAGRLLDTSAAAGAWKSSVVLGVLARDGKGMQSDPEKAYYHFQVAVLQGGNPAMELLQRDLRILSDKLDADKLAELTENANAWFQQHQLALAFVNKDGEHWKRFPASARAASAMGMQAGQLLPLPPG